MYVNENTASIFWYTSFKNDLVSQCELISAIILILFLSHSIFRLFMWRLNGAVISQKEENMERILSLKTLAPAAKIYLQKLFH